MNDKNQRCTLLAYETVEDAAGFVDEENTIESAVEVWCKVASVSGKEIATMGQNNIKPALKMCAQADALLIVGKDEEGWQAGETVAVELKYPYSIPS